MKTIASNLSSISLSFIAFQVYYVTVYFVDPSTVCFDGRTSSQFKEEATGNALYLVSGPDAVQTNIKMPVTEEEIKDEVKRLKIWAKVLNLGTKFNYLIFIGIVDCAISCTVNRFVFSSLQLSRD